jgi:hypothetical protein
MNCHVNGLTLHKNAQFGGSNESDGQSLLKFGRAQCHCGHPMIRLGDHIRSQLSAKLTLTSSHTELRLRGPTGPGGLSSTCHSVNSSTLKRFYLANQPAKNLIQSQYYPGHSHGPDSADTLFRNIFILFNKLVASLTCLVKLCFRRLERCPRFQNPGRTTSGLTMRSV